MADLGGKYNFETPEQLRAKADEYFAWCDANPIRGQRTLKKEDGEITTRDDQYPRPYTFEGLALHLNIVDWAAFVKNNKEREGFADVFGYIRNKVRRNQIEGSMVGLYRENLTARLNGIAENMNVGEVPPPSTIEVVDGPEE